MRRRIAEINRPLLAGLLALCWRLGTLRLRDPAADRLRARDRRCHRGARPRWPSLRRPGRLYAEAESGHPRQGRALLRQNRPPATPARGALLRRRASRRQRLRPLQRRPQWVRLPLVLQPVHGGDRGCRPLRADLHDAPLAQVGVGDRIPLRRRQHRLALLEDRHGDDLHGRDHGRLRPRGMGAALALTAELGADRPGDRDCDGDQALRDDFLRRRSSSCSGPPSGPWTARSACGSASPPARRSCSGSPRSPGTTGTASAG